MTDQRKFPRVDEKWKVTYRVLNQERLKDPILQYSVNISGGGICFTSDEAIQPNTMVSLEMESEPFPAPILALAKVVWCHQTHGGVYEVGAAFWWVGWKDNDAQQAIANQIASIVRAKETSANES